MRVDIVNKRKKELGLTNKKLSEISGVPIGTLSKVMAGLIANPKLGTLRAIADALGCTLDDFSDDSENKNIKNTQADINMEFVITEFEKELILRYRAPPMNAVSETLFFFDSTLVQLLTLKKAER